MVHRVRDLRCGSALAGKFAFETSEGFAEASLVREGAMLARLRHDNIISLIDRGHAGGAHYLVLEYAPGDTLANRIARRRSSPLEATCILIDVVAGLAHAHQRGILHLDIKPSNVMALPNGRAKIIDFGAGSMPIGDFRPDEEDLAPCCHILLTRVEPPLFAKGTLLYMAPEQWSLDPSHPRMDLWAAGMLYYEMLLGRLPFGTQPACLRLRASQLERVPFSAREQGMPASIEEVFARTLALDPCDRFSTATALLETLTRVRSDLASSA